MIVSAIKSADRTGSLAKQATSTEQAMHSNPQSTTSTVRDTVQISGAAQAALKEVIETPAQTAKEANSGDHQAQRLLAIEAAARKA
jgi:hypothetical protein